MSRAQTTQELTDATLAYAERRGWPATAEVQISAHSRRRLDVLAWTTRFDRLIGFEVKSCPADFRTDDKWLGYLQHVDAFYLVANHETSEACGLEAVARRHGCGLLVGKRSLGSIVKASRLPATTEGQRADVMRRLVVRFGCREQREAVRRITQAVQREANARRAAAAGAQVCSAVP